MTKSAENSASRPAPYLVIGWGNNLRGDDAAGRRVAETVAAWPRPDIAALPVHQLTPELADALVGVKRVVFVDACPAATGAAVRVEALIPADGTRSGAHGHHGDPAHLLQMAREIYGTVPQAWLIAIPGYHFGLGESLSPQTREGVEEALRQVDLLLAENAADP